MTNRDAFLQLRDRLYAATGPSWELNARIEQMIAPDKIVLFDAGSVGPIKRAAVRGPLRDFPMEGWEGEWNWEAVAREVMSKRYTGCTDDAMTLTPEGWVYEISQAIGDKPLFTARIWRLEPFDTYTNFGEYRRDGRVMSMDEYRKALRWEPTAALALCLARVHYEITQGACGPHTGPSTIADR